MASHWATTKAEKRKRDAQEEGCGTGNFFCDLEGRGRGKYHAQHDNNEPRFNQHGFSGINSLDGRFYLTSIMPFLILRLLCLHHTFLFTDSIGVENIIYSIDMELEQNPIKENKNEFKKKKPRHPIKKVNRTVAWQRQVSKLSDH